MRSMKFREPDQAQGPEVLCTALDNNQNWVLDFGTIYNGDLWENISLRSIFFSIIKFIL